MSTIIINKDNLEITKEVKSSWSREELENTIAILTADIATFQTQLTEKKALLKQLDQFIDQYNG